MCPACIAGMAVMVAATGSTGGFLAVCVAKCRKFFTADNLKLFQRMREKTKWQPAIRKRISH